MAEPLHIYLIPGMGADHRLFQHMKLDAGEVHYLNWKPHGASRTLADYAHRMAEHITTEHNVVIGSSMGGMMAVELSRIVRPLSTVLISAPAGRHEFPPLLRLVHRTGIQHALTPKQVLRISGLADTFMGFRTREHRELFYDMLRGNGPEFLHFSVRAVLGWKNTDPPTGEYLQIIGSRDRLFRAHRMRSPIVLEGSGHFTAFEKADELSGIINTYLREQILPKVGR